MKETGVYQHISQNHYNHFLLTHACNSRPNPSIVFMQIFAGNRVNGILSTSAMPQSHSHTGHTPTNTWGAAWKIALWNLESFMKFFAWEKTLTSSSVSTVVIPTQNSTIRARTGNTTFVLCEKGYSGFFLMKRECDSKGIHPEKKQCRDMPCGLSGLYNTSPWAEQFSLTELFMDIYSEQPYCRIPQASLLNLLSRVIAHSSHAPSSAMDYL